MMKRLDQDPGETTVSYPDLNFKHESKLNVFKALLFCQAEVLNITTDDKNPHFRSTFTSIEKIIRVLKPIWVKHGLIVVQDLKPKSMSLRTKVIHAESGESETFIYPLCPVKMDPQGIGGAITYFRRQALKGIFAVAEEDDDGNEASRAPKYPAQQNPAAAPAPTEKPVENKATPTIDKLKSQTAMFPSAPQKEMVNHAPTTTSGRSEAQVKRLFAIARSKAMKEEDLRLVLKQGYDKPSFSVLDKQEYDELCSAIEAGQSASEIIRLKGQK
jgi:hypothetical protein